MNDEHDYKSALKDKAFLYRNPLPELIGLWAIRHQKAIQHALRLAERLQGGEVSGRMIDAAQDDFDKVDIFKDMAAQMMKEIKDD